MATRGSESEGDPAPRLAPVYPVAAIDNTLRTLKLLNTTGHVRVVDVARHLDVGRSTAHRLLAMLAYHGLAEQDVARVYHPCAPRDLPGGYNSHALAVRAHPVLVDLAAETGRTVHVAVLEGNGARFLYGVSPTAPDQLTLRNGLLYPAHLTAAGRVLLADLDREALQRLFPARTGRNGVAAVDHLLVDRSLAGVRRRGFAVNEGDNETGVNAVAVRVEDPSGCVVGALVAAGAADEVPREDFAALAEVLHRSAARLRASL